jgi:hypothetical protein
MTALYESTKSHGRRIDRHRLAMEQEIGRQLGRFEFVHHENGEKRDNRLENLSILTPKEHAAIHLQKHPIVKICVVCGREFMPHPTHRERAKTCSQKCRYDLLSLRLRDPRKPHSMYRDDAYPSRLKSRRSL